MLKNKTVFITGASSGIGKACAEQCAAAGANVVICARQMESLKAMSHQLQAKYGVKVHCFSLDVQQRELVTALVNTREEPWKSVDILINNAGLAAGLDFLQEGSIDDWETMIDTNVKGLLYVTRAILPQMIKRNSGHIVNVGSIAGHQVYPKGAVYCATKQAVNALSNALRMDLMGTALRVSSVDPGAVETNFSKVRFKGDEARAAAVYEGMTPLQPDDVADAIVYCITRPPHVNVNEIIIMPTDQASATMMHRRTKPTKS
jgi:NADP-dependent 3-hydroxy acid dehydrogenase YdfG